MSASAGLCLLTRLRDCCTPLRRYAAEARETLQLSWSLWIPIHTVTFSLVPVPLRTHFSAAMSFVTLTAMSALQCSLESRRDEAMRADRVQRSVVRWTDSAGSTDLK